MEFNPLPDLLNTGFTIIEIDLFYDDKHKEAKMFRFLTFCDKIAIEYRSVDVTESLFVKSLVWLLYSERTR